MTESMPMPMSPAASAVHRGRRIAQLLLQGFCLLIESVAFIWLIDRLAAADWLRAICIGQLVLMGGTAWILYYFARNRRRNVYDPLRRLELMLGEIRSGHLSAEALSTVDGLLAPVAGQFLEMFTELRTQKHIIAGMDRDLKHRIATKTEALERKIGSLRQQATRDALTGLLNRRALDEHLTVSIERAAKAGTPLSVLMVDVDNFKLLNDSLGHACGDELLRQLGQIFKSTLRENDAAFRCGGDEFVVVLESSDASAAVALANRLTSLVDGLARTLKVAAPPRLSIGAASLRDVAAPTAEALLREADSRLYTVKAGRKRLPRPDGHLPAAAKMVQSSASPR